MLVTCDTRGLPCGTVGLASDLHMQLMLLFILSLLAATVSAAPDGAELFGKHCAVCHGDKGGENENCLPGSSFLNDFMVHILGNYKICPTP